MGDFIDLGGGWTVSRSWLAARHPDFERFEAYLELALEVNVDMRELGAIPDYCEAMSIAERYAIALTLAEVGVLKRSLGGATSAGEVQH